MNMDWRSRLRSMISQLEMGMWDNQQIQNLFDVLESQPDAILPQYVGLSSYVAFLCMKIDRSAFSRRILYATLHWQISTDQEPAKVETTIENIQHVEKIMGQEHSPEQIRQQALDRSYGKT